MSEVKRYGVQRGNLIENIENSFYIPVVRAADFDAKRLRADTAEDELDAVKQALDATRDALEAAKYAKGELTTRLSEHEQLFYDLTHSPHAVAVPLELWNRIEVFADAALNQKSEGES